MLTLCEQAEVAYYAISLYNLLAHQRYLGILTGGRTGFDGVVEVEEAGSGFSLTTLKNGKRK